jgi:hypothetical protein
MASGMASTDQERHNKRRAERYAKRRGMVSNERTGEEMDSKVLTTSYNTMHGPFTGLQRSTERGGEGGVD